ncbi:MAG: exosortase/archaeosortase family protein [Phycisphaeraceae bacterium]
MLPRSWRRNGWSPWHLVAAAVLAALAVGASFNAWADIMRIGVIDEESSHIFLVPIVAAWLVWVRRARISQCRPVGLAVGPLILALGWFLSWYGYHNGYQSLWHGGAVLTLIGALCSVLGREVLVRFLPAFLVLGFLVPIPGIMRQQIAIPLQTATAQITQDLVELGGASIDRTGNLLRINGVDVAVAEACNGMRMVFALVLVSYAFAFGTPLRWYARGLVIVASPLVALVVNVIRMMPTVWLYGYSPQHVADAFHDWSGWIMLGIAFLLLMAILQILRWAMIPVTRYTLAQD